MNLNGVASRGQLSQNSKSEMFSYHLEFIFRELSTRVCFVPGKSPGPQVFIFESAKKFNLWLFVAAEIIEQTEFFV